MNITVEYKDTAGTISSQTHNLTRLAFSKHLAIAGQGYAPRPQKFIRTIAMFFHYSNYIQRQAFNNDRFSEPPIQLSDLLLVGSPYEPNKTIPISTLPAMNKTEL